MKTSTKVLGGTLLLILLLLTSTVIWSRIYLNRNAGNFRVSSNVTVELGADSQVRYDNKDFNRITLGGIWKAKLTRGEEYSIKVSAPINILDSVSLEQTGRTLQITNNFPAFAADRDVLLEITLPDLEDLTLSGGAQLSFEGFQQKDMKLILSGAGQITGEDSRCENLTVIFSGAGQMDLMGLSAVNADVTLSGAGELLLHMNGGNLSGKLSGMGSIEYDGNVKNEGIVISGLGDVSRR